MSPATHGLAGLIVGSAALKICPALSESTGKEAFMFLAFLAGQLPDVDLLSLLMLKKKTREKSPLYQHRGYGHSLIAHLLYSTICPFLIGCYSQCYWAAFLYFFTQVALHLFFDMIDGSFGIYYLAPICNKPFACYGLVEDVDDALINWRAGSRLRVTRRVVFEALLVNIPLLVLGYAFAR